MPRPDKHYRVEDPHGVYAITAVEIAVKDEFGPAATEYEARKKAFEAMAGCEFSDVDPKVADEAIASFSCWEIPGPLSFVPTQVVPMADRKSTVVLKPTGAEE
jgi:hypothetical protein